MGITAMQNPIPHSFLRLNWPGDMRSKLVDFPRYIDAALFWVIHAV